MSREPSFRPPGGILAYTLRGIGGTPVRDLKNIIYSAQSRQALQVYKSYESDTISCVPILLGPPTFYTSNLDVARQLVSGSSAGRSFNKPEAASKTILCASFSELLLQI